MQNASWVHCRFDRDHQQVLNDVSIWPKAGLPANPDIESAAVFFRGYNSIGLLNTRQLC